MKALSVLVVEDDAMIGMLLAEMLSGMGYNVCAIAATEEDAVAKAARSKPGLLIVDEQLREGSGASAVDRIMQAGPILASLSPVPRRRLTGRMRMCCESRSWKQTSFARSGTWLTVPTRRPRIRRRHRTSSQAIEHSEEYQS
jgi:CheY-like chemotaxis protein